MKLSIRVVMEMAIPIARELWRTPKDLRDKFQPSPGKPQRKRKPRSAIGLIKLFISKWGSQFVFQLFGTLDLLYSAMQVCNPQEIYQARSQFQLHSRVSVEKTPCLTWLRTRGIILFQCRLKYYIFMVLYLTNLKRMLGRNPHLHMYKSTFVHV